MPIKHCKPCRRDIPIDRFSRDRMHKSGLRSHCKECISERNRARRRNRRGEKYDLIKDIDRIIKIAESIHREGFVDTKGIYGCEADDFDI